MLDRSAPAVSEFLSRLPEETEGAAVETRPLVEQAALLEKKDEGFVVPTQACFFPSICLSSVLCDIESACGQRSSLFSF